MIEIGVQGLEQIGRWLARRIAVQQPRFHQMRELAEAHRAGHPRASLERVQRAPQLLRDVHILRLPPPCAHLIAGLRIKLRGFLEKDFEHLQIDVVPNAGQWIADFRRHPDFRFRFLLRFFRRRRVDCDGGVVAQRGFRRDRFGIDVAAADDFVAERFELVFDRLRLETIVAAEFIARAHAAD